MKSVGQIIERDIAMSAKVLQLVNSAFFGLPQHVASPSQAVVLLGLETVKMLVLTTHVFSQFEERKLGGLQINALWRHSLAVAAMAKGIARAEQAPPKSIDHAFMAGMLHDVGKLILAANIPDPYHAALAMAKQKAMPPQDAERMFLGATHAEVGAYLLGLWGLPDSIVIATALHHRPRAQYSMT